MLGYNGFERSEQPNEICSNSVKYIYEWEWMMELSFQIRGMIKQTKQGLLTEVISKYLYECKWIMDWVWSM